MRTAVSIGLPGTTPAATIAALAPRIERLGYRGLWLNDVPNGDSLAGLRTAASVTSTLELATGAIPLDRRPAASLDLSDLPVERTVIGVASGASRHPRALVGEGVAMLRQATDAAIVVAALGPRMRRLAAEQADGVLFNWLTPAAAAEAMVELRQQAGGRAVRGVLYCRTITDELARGELERESSRYESYPSYAANFDRLGFRAMESTIDGADALTRFDGVVDEVVLRAVTLAGTLGELERFVEESAGWHPIAA